MHWIGTCKVPGMPPAVISRTLALPLRLRTLQMLPTDTYAKISHTHVRNIHTFILRIPMQSCSPPRALDRHLKRDGQLLVRYVIDLIWRIVRLGDLQLICQS